jgi:hypothetical protein
MADEHPARNLADLRSRIDAIPTKKKLVVVAVIVFVVANVVQHFGY